ncbi:unnamed protein product [Vitrella brassicaformis CCMP3155]|uniref:Dynein heavy chain AAA module D4 domain-containing protein n=1 Tax=Vitrella brassicaformis (strain CCMP3155) TaxID=1169540 RepID=A0A0G4H096_VITBC|nr:unnamed protein product [Vitrella brassicaformis CCMP3155]|eukprot:CEM36931.1 unnamed protein product [Vitrella brassicaformis CCMP3155]
MNLVLFDDALKHIMRISRIMQLPRGSAMLAFFDNLRGLYVDADQEVKQESFLEYLNSVLSTGEVAGLFQKDERDGMCAEIRKDFVKERPWLEENMISMYQYFFIQEVPALFSCVTIDRFLRWPEEALIAMASAFLSDDKVDTSPENKEKLYRLMDTVHAQVGTICDLYFAGMCRHVYVTPKTHLLFINFYKKVYEEKFDEINKLERAVNVGLQKLSEATADVDTLPFFLVKYVSTTVLFGQPLSWNTTCYTTAEVQSCFWAYS